MDSETVKIMAQEDREMDLPPGFRFHPTDEELITHYLCKKIGDDSFSPAAVGEADLNKCEPWDLPGRAKMGENEWYFFYHRDKKYPTGLRTNRATDAGYWKATGKDKEIFRGKSLIGMKKTLVFYTGRAPKGEKSNWVMHEYRLEGKLSLHNLSESAKTEWVISRVFEKRCNLQKIDFRGVSSFGKYEGFVTHSQLPPLTDFSQSDVSCFSGQFSFPRARNEFDNTYKIERDQVLENSGNRPSSIFDPLFNYRFPGSMLGQDYQIAQEGYLDKGFWPSIKFEHGGEMTSASQETGLTMDVNMHVASNPGMSSRSGSGYEFGSMDPECTWPY